MQKILFWIALATFSFPLIGCQTTREPRPPNIIIVFADDLGYGDLSCYGHPTLITPHLDRMAREGVRLTSFYAQPSCTPSRAALLTGRQPMRSGMYRVIFPEEDVSLPASELTLAKALKGQGYRTAAIGKWHLGHKDVEDYPISHGFDEYYGLLYSNDMTPPWVPTEAPLKLYRNAEPIEHPVDQPTLSERYTQEAVKWIREWKDSPFFIYLAHAMPHQPISASERFLKTSPRGLYGDVVTTIDWGVGRILEALQEEGIDENTLADSEPVRWNRRTPSRRKGLDLRRRDSSAFYSALARTSAGRTGQRRHRLHHGHLLYLSAPGRGGDSFRSDRGRQRHPSYAQRAGTVSPLHLLLLCR